MSLAVPAAYEQWMRRALADARLAFGTGDVPVAALVVDGLGDVIGTGRNERELRHDPTAHAEVLALREAAASRDDWHLEGCTLVVTLEPCVMCAGAVLAARIPTVVFGAWDEKAGAGGSVYDVLRDRRLNHRVEVFPGVLAEECGEVLLDFFRAKR
ncbi:MULTISPECIES: tRNA adenosine(34) deaminase TadA [unclassified Leifsonia]|uniref:tRNA adenosine(34) deaminase TadA n=1 Tax=unclassified Leifsonia TaxID=2663824 RepID=UPI0008A79BBF|nr:MULTISPECIES: tRNA adenosine(34) deaminase TadA [unclassified Leifsonia]SEH57894.1 tRNA-adenosine deaminase [Leifsonia sp. CL154]SFL21048.1 tRNA-adenosine deaminase [Leifsonia sp. CL147]